MFESLARHGTSKKGVYLKPGLYELVVKSHKWVPDKQAFVASFEVVESSNTTDHPVGSTVDFYQSIAPGGQKWDGMAQRAINSYLHALGGFRAGETPVPAYDAIASVAIRIENPFAGFRVRAEAMNQIKKDKSGSYVAVNYETSTYITAAQHGAVAAAGNVHASPFSPPPPRVPIGASAAPAAPPVASPTQYIPTQGPPAGGVPVPTVAPPTAGVPAPLDVVGPDGRTYRQIGSGWVPLS